MERKIRTSLAGLGPLWHKIVNSGPRTPYGSSRSEKRLQIGHHAVLHRNMQLDRVAADMRGQNHIRKRGQRVRRMRLGRIDVKASAGDGLVGERRDQRLLIHHRAAGDIDDIAVGAEPFQDFRVDGMMGVGAGTDRDHQDAAPFRQCREAREIAVRQLAAAAAEIADLALTQVRHEGRISGVGVPVVGYSDAILSDGTVVDWKVSRQWREDWKTQVSLYHLLPYEGAMERLLNGPCRVVRVYNGKVAVYDFGADTDAAEEYVRQAWETLRAEKHPMTPGQHCGWCSVREECAVLAALEATV